jgi:uncharacterized membrane protein
MTFDDGEMAQVVYSSLQAMRKSRVLGLDDSVILTKDGAVRAQVHPGSPTRTGLAELLAEIVFPCSGRVVPAEAGARLDDQFVEPVASALCDNGSALLFFVESDSLSDTRELLDALALFRGTIHQTTLSPQDEAVLRRML